MGKETTIKKGVDQAEKEERRRRRTEKETRGWSTNRWVYLLINVLVFRYTQTSLSLGLFFFLLLGIRIVDFWNRNLKPFLLFIYIYIFLIFNRSIYVHQIVRNENFIVGKDLYYGSYLIYNQFCCVTIPVAVTLQV